MINELYHLTEALEQADIEAQDTYPKYKLIPKITKKNPCVHIILDHGKIYKVENVAAKLESEIRRYGSNQGMYPGMNIAPLYRLTEQAEKKLISDLIDGKTTDFNIEDIRNLCKERNWGNKFQKKYRNSMQNVPQELRELFFQKGIDFPQFQILLEETNAFVNEDDLYRELEMAAFSMLTEKRGIALALQILFYSGKPEKVMEDDYGTLSVVFDSRQLMEEGLSVATADFTSVLNQKLIEADTVISESTKGKEVDAFNKEFQPLEEPMPTVKLAAGFDVTLRTMFRGQPCQTRYGRIENATYPISKELRYKLQSALEWMSKAERENVTWRSIDRNEVLFAYPETPRENMYSLINFLKRQSTTEENNVRGKKKFEEATKAFIEEFEKTKEPGKDPKSERIQYFILRKLDKARTKVVYTYNATPAEIEMRSEEWTTGCRNLPLFPFGQPNSLFPMDVADVLNQIWRQDGKLATDKFKLIPRYHGMQLLFGEQLPVIRRDLYVLMQNTTNLAAYVGKMKFVRGSYDETQVVLQVYMQRILALMGLLLYQLDIRKEKYMQEFPYQFGQLLKISDALHEMYCKIVRERDIPNTFAGCGMYGMGAEHPYKALALLGQRMNPYITWGKSYRAKDIQTKDMESWRVGWYLDLYEQTATELHKAWGNQTRFNEEEKAQYFIGYLAAFPKREKSKTQTDKSMESTGKETDMQENIEYSEGGNENE